MQQPLRAPPRRDSLHPRFPTASAPVPLPHLPSASETREPSRDARLARARSPGRGAQAQRVHLREHGLRTPAPAAKHHQSQPSPTDVSVSDTHRHGVGVREREELLDGRRARAEGDAAARGKPSPARSAHVLGLALVLPQDDLLLLQLLLLQPVSVRVREAGARRGRGRGRDLQMKHVRVRVGEDAARGVWRRLPRWERGKHTVVWAFESDAMPEARMFARRVGGNGGRQQSAPQAGGIRTAKTNSRALCFAVRGGTEGGKFAQLTSMRCT